MYGYAQDKYLMAKTIPASDVVDDDDDHYGTLATDPATKGEPKKKTPARGVDESTKTEEKP
jgi:hypothetical protein